MRMLTVMHKDGVGWIRKGFTVASSFETRICVGPRKVDYTNLGPHAHRMEADVVQASSAQGRHPAGTAMESARPLDVMPSPAYTQGEAYIVPAIGFWSCNEMHTATKTSWRVRRHSRRDVLSGRGRAYMELSCYGLGRAEGAV